MQCSLLISSCHHHCACAECRYARSACCMECLHARQHVINSDAACFKLSSVAVDLATDMMAYLMTCRLMCKTQLHCKFETSADHSAP